MRDPDGAASLQTNWKILDQPEHLLIGKNQKLEFVQK